MAQPFDTLVFFVNGTKIIEERPDPEVTLLTYLRTKLRLTGTKLGCGEGGCGACTVMVSRVDRIRGAIVYSVNACLAPVCSVHGLSVTTVEGIGSTRTRLHPVQERLAASHGSQCGFCTPGIIMSMYTLLRNNPLPARADLEQTFQGNLCRCTGYRPILTGFASFTKGSDCAMGEQCCRNKSKAGGDGVAGFDGQGSDCAMGEQCCRNKSKAGGDGVAGFDGQGTDCAMGEQCCRNNLKAGGDGVAGSDGVCSQSGGALVNGQVNGDIDPCSEELFDVLNLQKYDPSQEPIFPSELQLSSILERRSVEFHGPRVTWYRPTRLHELLSLKKKFPDARLVVGNTEIGVEVKIKRQFHPVYVAATHVSELLVLRLTNQGMEVGASVTLASLEDSLKKAVAKLPGYQTRGFTAILEMLQWFSGPQIRNVAAVGGNIMTASPISDLNPILAAGGATLTIAAEGGATRTTTLDGKFFTGYRQTALQPEEVLVSLLVPFTTPDEYFESYKQARRREDDIAIVNAGMRVQFGADTDIIQGLFLSYGGMAPTTVMAKKTMNNLIGRHWDDSMLEDACLLLAEDLPLPAGVPGGMESYRRTLTTSFFYKFYVNVLCQLDQHQAVIRESVLPKAVASAAVRPLREPSRGSQFFQSSQDCDERRPVGQPLRHLSGTKHTTGEAVYTDDMPPYRDELYLALVTSTKAHARIMSVDASKALQLPGVVSYVDHTDVPGQNVTGPVDKDEEVFASNTVTYQGNVIGAIVAESAFQARLGADAVRVEYEELDPIITIDQAIAADSYYLPHKSINHGNIEGGFQTADHVITGEVRMGGQEHFYLETMVTIAVPRGEDGDMEIFCSCQSPSEAQIRVCEVLGVEANKVNLRVKRLGGGFGGKQTRYSTVLLPVVVAAAKLGRPVRCMLDRDVDMLVTGTRHPFLAKYMVGYTSEGRIVAADLTLYSNCGNSADLSWPVLEKAMLTADNAYRLDNVRVTGHACRTHIASCTAYRGFGGPQGMLVIETVVQHIADSLGLPPDQVRALNLCQEGYITYYGMKVENANLQKCWDDVMKQSDFRRRRTEVDRFNKENRWRKRGLTIIPTKFGIAFTELWFNQGGALVHIYQDGSVLVAHSGTEMGQGLHTKMVQIASQVLGVAPGRIHINETSPATVPNMSPTAASSGSDLNGMAVLDACQKLARRLAPYMKKSTKPSWNDMINAAYMDRVGLSASGFYKTPDISGFDWETPSARQPYNYFTCGAAVTEVEVDCLTGDHVILRTDIVMDIGQSLNPAIDIGQIEGGFVQGYGLFVLEEQRYSPRGVLFTRGPGTYKLPGFSDIPVDFHVTILPGTSNPRAVFSSKAVGEPPLFLGSSVFFAIRDAIVAARKESGLSGYFRLDSPATAERIRMACEDQFTKQFPPPAPGSYVPWAVDL